MVWNKFKMAHYAQAGIPKSDLVDFDMLLEIKNDPQISAELKNGGGVKATSPDGKTDLPFYLNPETDLANGTISLVVKVTLLASAKVGDPHCRVYFSSTETTREDKEATLSAYAIPPGADLSTQGGIRFAIYNPNENWITDDTVYRFNEAPPTHGISVGVAKYVPNKLEIRISGPYSRNFWFFTDAPPFHPKGILIALQWKADGTLTLFINGIPAETKHRDSPQLAKVNESKSHEVFLQAVRFDYTSQLLSDHTSRFPRAIAGQFHPTEVSNYVCEAFALELYLKAILTLEGIAFTKKHELDYLYSLLPQDWKQRIDWAYGRLTQASGLAGSSPALDSIMGVNSKAFQQWRYVFEGPPPASGDLCIAKNATVDAILLARHDWRSVHTNLGIQSTLQGHLDRVPIDALQWTLQVDTPRLAQHPRLPPQTSPKENRSE